jgi:hypothetical protein
MQQLGNDSTVEITGAGAPTGPTDPSIFTGMEILAGDCCTI